jgi:Leucine-rich repeat (LRR) protein
LEGENVGAWPHRILQEIKRKQPELLPNYLTIDQLWKRPWHDGQSPSLVEVASSCQDYDVQYHQKAGELNTPAYSLLPDGQKLTAEMLLGAKVRIVPRKGSSADSKLPGSRRPIEGRAVPISVVKRFHEQYPGNNSRAKQHQMLADVQVHGHLETTNVYADKCGYGRMKPDELPLEFVPNKEYAVWLYPDFEHDKSFPEKSMQLIDGKYLRRNPKRSDKKLSWVEWAADHETGPADLMVSYSWTLNWTYLIVFMEAVFGPDALVWIDILACGQHQIDRGTMDEISLLPEVLDYAGKAVVMPGTAARMWCNYEFGWSVELNSKQLFYADFRTLGTELRSSVEAQLSPELQQAVDTLVKCDRRLLELPGSLLIEYPDVEVNTKAVDGLDVATDGTKGAFLGKKTGGDALLAGPHKVLMYKSAKEVEVQGTALTLCGRCWNPADEAYIRKTIQDRLGGSMQVCCIIKEAFGVTATAELSAEATEEEILTHLFMESRGPEWKNTENWCDPQAPLQNWFGVATDNRGHVTSLDLPRNGVGFISITIRHLPTLRVVSLQENPLDATKMADTLKASTSITQLNLARTGLGHQGTMLVAEALRNLTLAKLNISGNDIGELVLPDGWTEESKVEGSGWDKKTVVTYQHTDGRKQIENPSRPLGIIALADTIKNNRTLQTLDISDNQLQAVGLKHLADGLIGNETLSELDVSQNDATEDETSIDYSYDASGVRALAVSIQSTALTLLNISQNDIGGNILPDGWAEYEPPNKTFGGPNRRYKHTDGRDQQEHPGTPECAVALAMLFEKLTSVDISNCSIGTDGATHLAAAIRSMNAISVITFNSGHASDYGGDTRKCTMDTGMAVADFSNKHLSGSGAIIVAAFIQKCK